MFVVIHFAIIIAYAWPESMSYQPLHRYAASYVEPIFTQRWSMFAPCPTMNTVVEVNYKFSNTDSSGWIRPSENAVNRHDKLPLLHYGELVIAEANLDYWLGLDLRDMGLKVPDPFPMSKADQFLRGYSYYKIKNYVDGWGRRLYDEPFIAAEVRFYRKDVVTGDQGLITLPIYYFDDAE